MSVTPSISPRSAGGDLGEILGVTAPYPPSVHPGRTDEAGSVSAAGGAENRRDRLRRNDARADGAVSGHEPQRALPPARRYAARGGARAAARIYPASE